MFHTLSAHIISCISTAGMLVVAKICLSILNDMLSVCSKSERSISLTGVIDEAILMSKVKVKVTGKEDIMT